MRAIVEAKSGEDGTEGKRYITGDGSRDGVTRARSEFTWHQGRFFVVGVCVCLGLPFLSRGGAGWLVRGWGAGGGGGGGVKTLFLSFFFSFFFLFCFLFCFCFREGRVLFCY